MVTLANGGAWLVNGAEIIADGPKAQAELGGKDRTDSIQRRSKEADHCVRNFRESQYFRQHGKAEN